MLEWAFTHTRLRIRLRVSALIRDHCAERRSKPEFEFRPGVNFPLAPARSKRSAPSRREEARRRRSAWKQLSFLAGSLSNFTRTAARIVISRRDRLRICAICVEASPILYFLGRGSIYNAREEDWIKEIAAEARFGPLWAIRDARVEREANLSLDHISGSWFDSR